jgi:YhcN/YlaJ family sporulation lipoprotein
MGKKIKIFAIVILAVSLFTVVLSGCTTQGTADREGTQIPQDNMQDTTNAPGNAPGQIGMLGTERGNDGNLNNDQARNGMMGVNPGQNGLLGNNRNQNGLLGNNNGMLGNSDNRNGLLGNNGNGNTQQTTIDVQKSRRIEEQLKNMNGIEDVRVIVNGNTALVGCKPSAAAGDPTAIRNQVAQKVKEIDNSVTDVRVSESPKILTDMERLSDNLTNNKPMDNIVEEFNRIFKGISPST